MMQPVEQQIWDLIEPGVDELGLRIVRVRVSGGSGNATLQIMVEPKECSKDNPVAVHVDQCAEVSRMASALLDVEDPIDGHYSLEVSSTGMERPLVTEADFTAYTGARIKMRMQFPVDGQRKFAGELKGFDAGNVIMHDEERKADVTLPYGAIHYAHLIFTDEEIQAFINKNS